jgi:hypothetical protein
MSSPVAFPSPRYGHNYALAQPVELPYPLENRFAGKEFRLLLGESPPSHNPLLSAKEERQPCSQPAWFIDHMLQDAVTPNHFQVGMVAEEWVSSLSESANVFCSSGGKGCRVPLRAADGEDELRILAVAQRQQILPQAHCGWRRPAAFRNPPTKRAQAHDLCLFQRQSWADSMILSLRRVKPLAKFILLSRVRYRNAARRRHGTA